MIILYKIFVSPMQKFGVKHFVKTIPHQQKIAKKNFKYSVYTLSAEFHLTQKAQYHQLR